MINDQCLMRIVKDFSFLCAEHIQNAEPPEAIPILGAKSLKLKA